MYSPSSPVLSQTLEQASVGLGGIGSVGIGLGGQHHSGGQCLKFKYFITFLICTTCLALLSASLATHKWIISKPIRILRLNGGQTNFTSLMLTAQNEHPKWPSHKSAIYPPSSLPLIATVSELTGDGALDTAPMSSEQPFPASQNNKFQGEIYFGLFKGVKVLNPGFGDRISPISVLQAYFAKDNNQQELINFKLWLLTVASVALAILFALIGSIFAIINFVMTPRGTLTGPVGLVVWNATACFACLLAMVAWLIEYFVRLQVNVLTMEEVQNGWTSENRSQFGYSYYFVVLAFVLHLVNIFIISIVQFETWTGNSSSKAAKRQSRAICEGVIMLY